MKKALRIGVASIAMAAVCTTGALFNLGQTNEGDLASPFIQTAVLRQGATGGEVKELQRRLKQWGYYSGSVDGIYGSKTVEAVKKFQRKNGLTVDGVAGISTYAALGMNDSVKVLENDKKQSNSNYTNSDLYLLAKCIYAEARGESYTGQVAVGAVIMNRVASSSFPNTISGVVYQKGAFTAVSDGQINLSPDKTAMNAAQDAMNGWDPTYGCLYYYNPAVATSSWIFGRKTITTIGKHVFAI
ncbi:MAG: spore cortex-lytic enzyme [Clostridia bacterium]|jgi:N-acetylmuramoyl-L-alanine amidase|nr:spore cortex-lytic enzyme [Clostridia bacterium]